MLEFGYVRMGETAGQNHERNGEMNGSAILNCIYRYTVTILGVGLVLAPAAFAGPLEPSEPPASSSVTLNKLASEIKIVQDNVLEIQEEFSLQGVPGGIPVPKDPGAVSATAGTEALSVTLQLNDDSGAPPIVGGVTTPGSEGQISVISMGHAIVTPRDAASGLPTGRRQHSPFTIVKQFDKASPKLFEACATGRHIPSAILSVRRAGATGQPETFYTITLTDCLITSMSTGFPNLEQVEFTYQKIEWTYVDGGITASDDWTEPTPAGK